MSAIRAADYVRLVRRELESLTVPTGPPRRTGVRDLERVLDVVRTDIRWIDAAVVGGEHEVGDGARAACGRAREITSLLYASGAPHVAWRHWAALSAFGLLIGRQRAPDGVVAVTHDEVEASQYALLAAEWDLAAALPPAPSPPVDHYAEHVVWALAVGRNAIDPPPVDDEEAGVWVSFFAAVSERSDHLATLALHTITELHIDLFGGGWERFVEWDYPLFDPVAGAAAALARRHGLVGDELSDLDRRYLDPGLASGDPEPMYPRHWPEPSFVQPLPAPSA